MNNPYFIVEKVGMDTEASYNKYPEFQVWEEGKQAGINEVVEWGNGDCPHDIQELSQSGLCTYKRDMPEVRRECPLCWQSKLKEWGIRLL
uniref:Uncharacterized protein n=1 Tax=viral metagenome TaxID=1070528 RepID=A0A6M3JK63_9ZZZZ